MNRWDGLYASFSAGGTWTKVNETLTDTENFSSISNSFNPPPLAPVGALNFTETSNQISNTLDSLSGKQAGAVFTFAMGYNVVWGSWLAGIQSEVSYNRNNVRLQGTSTSNSTGTTVSQFPLLPPVTGAFSSSSRNSEFANLENKYTISEMARLGFLVSPDWLIYGLVGWSWGGFDFVQQFGDSRPLTLSGITYGAGVEKDFGWLRAFVQYKGISYGSRNLDVSAPSTFQQTNSQAGVITSTFSQSSADSAVRRFSADVQQVTAGVTIPINFTR